MGKWRSVTDIEVLSQGTVKSHTIWEMWYRMLLFAGIQNHYAQDPSSIPQTMHRMGRCDAVLLAAD